MKKKGFRSLLFICLGLIATIVFTSAVMMVSPPDPPGRPQAVDVQRDRCKIKYAAPRYDGGSSDILLSGSISHQIIGIK